MSKWHGFFLNWEGMIFVGRRQGIVVFLGMVGGLIRQLDDPSHQVRGTEEGS